MHCSIVQWLTGSPCAKNVREVSRHIHELDHVACEMSLCTILRQGDNLVVGERKIVIILRTVNHRTTNHTSKCLY